MKRLFLGILAMCLVIGVKAQEVFSPDGKINVRFFLSEKVSTGNQRMYPEGTPYYEVLYDKHSFLLPSRMGFDLLGTAEMKHYFKVSDIEYTEHNSVWKPCYGEKQEYPDKYREMRIMLEETLYPYRKLYVIFRTYNEGIAFRYEIPYQNGFEKVVIDKELTEFAFPKNTSVWESHGHEGKYYKVYPFEVKTDCELPLTCQTPQGVYGAIMEAGNNHYPRAYLEAPYRRENILRISLRGEAKGERGMVTAWRVISLADEPGKLMEQNYLLYNLNESCKLADTSWIKPGTAMRETTISTPECLKMIDYCASMGISYMILDWGWYGLANSHKSDPSIVNVTNPATGQPIPRHPGLDLPKVINYGKEKGVGLFLYVNRQGLECYADKIFPLYQKWGIKGIKPGFVNVGNQEWQEWIESIVAKAAKYNLLVDIHDAYRPNGFSRTYPNLLTQEGIHGNEQVPNADHNTMLPFTRFTIGAGDYTPGYTRKDLQTTFAHRLALPVIYYSPAQFLFWNEKLTDEHKRPELDFWKNIPTVWQDTKFLLGEIGEYAVVARRSGTTWYVGGITNTNARCLQLDCSFLSSDKKYIATIYTDDVEVPGKIKITSRKITLKTKLSFMLQRSGGFSLKIMEL